MINSCVNIIKSYFFNSKFNMLIKFYQILFLYVFLKKLELKKYKNLLYIKRLCKVKIEFSFQTIFIIYTIYKKKLFIKIIYQRLFIKRLLYDHGPFNSAQLKRRA